MRFLGRPLRYLLLSLLLLLLLLSGGHEEQEGVSVRLQVADAH